MMAHQPVLLEAAVDALVRSPDGHYLDATFGRGGHARAIVERLGPAGRLTAMDRDPEAIAAGRRDLAGESRLNLVHSPFSAMADLVAGPLAGVFMDLGVSSPQLDQAERGFSFSHDGPLDMRMDPGSGQSVAQWLAQADEAEIADVLWRYGEERQSRRIARAICRTQSAAPITRTGQLAELIAATLGRRERSKHPATRSFQALRIFINSELDELEAGLAAALELLAPGGRLVVISFHSLEDRIVKQFIRGHGRPPGNRRLPPLEATQQQLRRIGPARRADEREIDANPRSRSAVMRVAEKCAS